MTLVIWPILKFSFLWVFYSFPSRIVGQATCGIWTMPPGMELVYDPQFDLDDSNDKENFQISFNLVNERNWTNTVQQGLAWNTIFESLKSMTKRKKWNFIWICKTNSYFWSQDWRFSYHGELQFSNLLSRDNFWNTNNDFCNKISQTRVSFALFFFRTVTCLKRLSPSQSATYR